MSGSGGHQTPVVQTKLEDALASLSRVRQLRRPIIRLAKRLDGGSLELRLLRRIFREHHDIDVGIYSYGGCLNATRVAAGTRIGKFCSFASHIHIFAANHNLGAATTHPFVYNPSVGIVDRDLREYNHVEIGSDAWMGQNAMIMPSVSSVGHGAVIAAGAIVTKDVPPYAVVAGVPAQLIKYRFPERVVDTLLEIQWWDWDPHLVFSLCEEFRTVDSFLSAACRVVDMDKRRS